MPRTLRTALSLLVVFVLLGGAAAHETQEIDGRYRVVVGFDREPPFTEERNGLYLSVHTVEDEPVANLQEALEATLVAPGGERLELDLRGVHGAPGRYTDDFVLTAPGVYRLELRGFVEGAEVELDFDLHEVRPFTALRFP